MKTGRKGIIEAGNIPTTALSAEQRGFLSQRFGTLGRGPVTPLTLIC